MRSARKYGAVGQFMSVDRLRFQLTRRCGVTVFEPLVLGNDLRTKQQQMLAISRLNSPMMVAARDP